MLQATTSFLAYLGCALVLLALFTWAYVKATPYDDFRLIGEGNSAAAVALSGALLGFALPLVAAIYYTVGIGEMLRWAALTCVVQLVLAVAVRRQAAGIAAGKVAPAIVVATLSVVMGLLVAACISE